MGDQARALSPEKKVTQPKETAEELVQDPVCQCYIPKSQSYTLSLEGKKLFFCSEECYNKYRPPMACQRVENSTRSPVSAKPVIWNIKLFDGWATPIPGKASRKDLMMLA